MRTPETRLGDPASGFEPTGPSMKPRFACCDLSQESLQLVGINRFDEIGIEASLQRERDRLGDAEGFPLATPENIFSINSEAIARP